MGSFLFLPCVFSLLVMFDSLRPHGLQHARPPCPSPSLGVCPSLCSLHWWCQPAISSSDALFHVYLCISIGYFLLCLAASSEPRLNPDHHCSFVSPCLWGLNHRVFTRGLGTSWSWAGFQGCLGPCLWVLSGSQLYLTGSPAHLESQGHAFSVA